MEELIHSVREIGVLQPIVVRPSRENGAEKYELVMGERRWRATQAAGLSTIRRLFVRLKTATCSVTPCWRTCTAAS